MADLSKFYQSRHVFLTLVVLHTNRRDWGCLAWEGRFRARKSGGIGRIPIVRWLGTEHEVADLLWAFMRILAPVLPDERHAPVHTCGNSACVCPTHLYPGQDDDAEFEEAEAEEPAIRSAAEKLNGMIREEADIVSNLAIPLVRVMPGSSKRRLNEWLDQFLLLHKSISLMELDFLQEEGGSQAQMDGYMRARPGVVTYDKKTASYKLTSEGQKYFKALEKKSEEKSRLMAEKKKYQAKLAKLNSKIAKLSKK